MRDADETVDGLKVTLKYHAGYESPWVVFGGSAEAVRKNLIQFAGLDCDTESDTSTLELVRKVTRMAQHGTPVSPNPDAQKAVATVVDVLGGEVIAETPALHDAPATASPEAAEEDPVIRDLKAALTKAQLTDAFRKHSAAIKANPNYQAVLKARSAEIA